MLLKELVLSNIRSYNNNMETSIDFPKGIVLFDGDVGSGKSTLLYAIEFALFGTAEVSGAHLLSEGKGNGHVRLTFLVDGKELEIQRGLTRRKESVAQERCYIKVDGKKTNISPTDLKERVIDLLRFNEPSNPRAESLVYRFAIFTPQERMKEIILKNSDDRLQVLRKVLGASDYKVAADNSGVVAQKIRTDAYGLRKASEDLEVKEAESESLSKEIDLLKKVIPTWEAKAATAAREHLKLEAQLKELLGEKDKVSGIAGMAPELRKTILMLERAVESELGTVRRLEKKVRERYLPFMQTFQKRSPPSEKNADLLEAEAAKKRTEKEEKDSDLRILLNQADETEELVTNKVCPRCGQEIPSVDFAGRLNHLRKEVEAMRAEIARLGADLSGLIALQKQMQKYEEDCRTYRNYEKERSEAEQESSEARDRASKYQTDLDLARRSLEVAVSEEEKLAGLRARITKLEEAVKDLQREKEDASNNLTKATTQRDEKSKSLDAMGIEIESKRRMRTEAGRLMGYQAWLAEYFGPAVEAIEKQMMTVMNGRFNHHFQRLFSALVDDADLRVRVKDDFSPVLERQGYEQDYDALSGGERTSVALAYRFALNAIVQEISTAGTAELVILDEPTEGFSKDQVYKMRDILRELGSKQVILVSHERELEAMAQHIFHVQKINGTSTIVAA